MDRRNFIKSAGAIGGAIAAENVLSSTHYESKLFIEIPWYNKSMRWAQLAFVENDPGQFDPDFWLSYFKRIHADGALLSAGGITAFYPTEIPLHHRSEYLGDKDLLGYMM